MLIIWGTTVRKVALGTVADHCHVCNELRAFSLREYFAVPHVYFIPLGSGKPSGVTRTCGHCQTESACQPHWYQKPVPEREAKKVPLQGLLQRTNPDAVYRLEQEAQWKQAAQRGDGDAARWLVLSKLRHCADAEGLASAHEDRLHQWDRLQPAARQALCQEIESYVARQDTYQRASWFVHALSQKAPKGAGCVPTIAVGIGMVALACWLISKLNLILHRDHQPWAALALLVTTLVLGFVVYWRFRVAAYRRFFQSQVVQPAEAQKQDLALVLRCFDALKAVPTDKEELREMLKHRHVLVQALEAAGKLPAASEPLTPVPPHRLDSLESHIQSRPDAQPRTPRQR